MAISPEGMMVATCVLIPFEMLTAALRWWLIRDRPRTKARNFSEFWAFCFQVANTTDLPLLILIWRQEMDVRDAHPSAEGPKLLGMIMNERYLKLQYSVSHMYSFEMWTLKAAFLALFYDLRGHLTTNMHRLLYLTTAFTCLTFLGNIAFQVSFCRPIQTIWQGKCNTLLSISGVTVSSWTNIVTDLGVLYIGVMIIRSLQSGNNTSRRASRALWVIPSIGSISMIATLARFILSYQIASSPEELTLEAVHKLFIYAYIEVMLAWIAFALPALRVLVARFVEKHTISYGSSRSGGHGPYNQRSRSKFSRQQRDEISVTTTYGYHSSQTELQPVAATNTVGDPRKSLSGESLP